MGVEEIGDKGEVEFGVTGDERAGGEEFAAVEFIGVLEDFFGTLVEITSLERGAAAHVRG